MSQVAHGGEDTNATENAGDGIDGHDDDGVAENGAVEPIVWAEGNQGTERDADRVEDLSGSEDPNLDSMVRSKLIDSFIPFIWILS